MNQFSWHNRHEQLYGALKVSIAHQQVKGPFKYYVIKEVDGLDQKMAIFADLQYYLCWRRWVGGPKKARNMLT